MFKCYTEAIDEICYQEVSEVRKTKLIRVGFSCRLYLDLRLYDLLFDVRGQWAQQVLAPTWRPTSKYPTIHEVYGNVTHLIPFEITLFLTWIFLLLLRSTKLIESGFSNVKNKFALIVRFHHFKQFLDWTNCSAIVKRINNITKNNRFTTPHQLMVNWIIGFKCSMYDSDTV